MLTIKMWLWLLVLTIVVIVIFICACVATWYMFGRPTQIALRRELRGEIATSVYPIDLKRVPPPSEPQRGIPKQIFRTWEDDSWKTSCRKAYDHTNKIVPSWNQRVFTSLERRKFVYDKFGEYPEIVEAYELCNYGVMQADLWRYLVIYHYGGLYLDMKSAVIAPIDFDLNVDKAYVTTWNYVQNKYLFGDMGEYQMYCVCAPPKSEFLWKVIWQVVRNIIYLRDHDEEADFLKLGLGKGTKYKILGTTGPLVYTYIAHKFPYTVTKLEKPNLNGSCIPVFTTTEYNRNSKSHYSHQTKPLLKKSQLPER